MIHIGTSGYSYEDWIGPFYPRGMRQADMLVYYAEHFGFTEINSTYYKMPNAAAMNNLQKKTPTDFVFTVKLHQSMTHDKNATKQDYQSFAEAMSVLKQAGKLGCLVAQFPYSFHYNRENIDYLLRLKEKLPDFKLVVEFRNSKWLDPATFRFMGINELGYVCVDEPVLAGLPDQRGVATSKTAYIRFHGRNSEKWWDHQEAYERYDYLYSEEELLEWTDKIHRLQENTEHLFISFNNHFKAQAVANAQMLRAILELSREI